MLSTIKKFGLYGLLASLFLFAFVFYVGKNASYSVQETLGYLSILIALSFVFLGMRDFRNNVNGGKLSVRQGLTIGLAISALVSIGSGISDYFYVTVLNPDFVNEYSTVQIEKLRESLPPAQFELEKAALLEQVESLGNPFVMAMVMFMTVLVLGILVSIISTLLLKKA